MEERFQSYEDEFDSHLRELFLVGIIHVICLSFAFVFVYRRRMMRVERMDGDAIPLMPCVLVAICLCFAQTSLLIVPLNEFIYCFPHIHMWLGIDGTRLSNYFANASTVGARFGFFVLNPFAYLISESIPGQGNSAMAASICSAFVELGLLLCMFACIGIVYFYSVEETMLNPLLVCGRLASIGIHLPGWGMFLFCAPCGLINRITCTLDSFVPRTVQVKKKTDEEKRELLWMLNWGQRSRNMGKPRRMGTVMETLIPPTELLWDDNDVLHPSWRNLCTLLTLFLVCFFTVMIAFRMLLPVYVTHVLFLHSRVIKVCPQLYLLFTSCCEYRVWVEQQCPSFFQSTTNKDFAFESLCLVAMLLLFSLSSPLILASLFGLFDILPYIAAQSSHDMFKSRGFISTCIIIFMGAFARHAKQTLVNRFLKPEGKTL